MNTATNDLLIQIGIELADIVAYSITVAAVSRDKSRNDLSQSNLVRSVGYVITEQGIEIIANSYWTAIEYGQKVGTNVPFEQLYEWAKRYNIRPRNGNFNDMVWAIKSAIYRKGTKSRPFINDALDRANKIINPFLDEWTNNQIGKAFENF